MRIVGRDLLDEFCARHADARNWLEAWLQEVGIMSWSTPQEIKDRYASVSFLPGNVVIFNVRGNHYRLEVHVAYKSELVTVQWIGTHPDYDARNRNR